MTRRLQRGGFTVRPDWVRQLAPRSCVLVICGFSPEPYPEMRGKQCFLNASKEDRRGPVGDVRLARAAECIECIQCIAATDMGSDTPLAARRIGSEALVRLVLSCAAIASILCVLRTTAALQREGRAPCEKSRGHVRLGRWCRTSVVPQGYSSSGLFIVSCAGPHRS